jgi:uncharacterized protein (TIGR00251 family)
LDDAKKPAGRRLEVKVTPNAPRSAIVGWHGDVLRVKIAAAPQKGRANRELIDFLSRLLGVKQSDISIIKGETGRNKVLEIRGINREEFMSKIQDSVVKHQ